MDDEAVARKQRSAAEKASRRQQLNIVDFERFKDTPGQVVSPESVPQRPEEAQRQADPVKPPAEKRKWTKKELAERKNRTSSGDPQAGARRAGKGKGKGDQAQVNRFARGWGPGKGKGKGKTDAKGKGKTARDGKGLSREGPNGGKKGGKGGKASGKPSGKPAGSKGK